MNEVVESMNKIAKDNTLIRPSGATRSRLTNEGFLPFKKLYTLLESILHLTLDGITIAPI